ncbi:hypothetical protein HELRODRAFT_162896 [Helobdella robusta]|uniref:Uncharacterized protein n=1 Tax=Helobdella robusta TaxID=6412 RepID=T1ETC2_HELRO|nr:hypothetical protein HELRODRAFT_162896 [Helobdella robusta]ESN99363.1 hypothetical protein HELRODRAFT_162896 [Helobdella robusta]
MGLRCKALWVVWLLAPHSVVWRCKALWMERLLVDQGVGGDQMERRRYKVCGGKGERYKLWWKGDDGTGGVGVMVREELVAKVLEVRRKSNGVIVVVMVFEKIIVRVISGYAPQQSRKEEEKDRFCDASDEIGQAGLDEFVAKALKNLLSGNSERTDAITVHETVAELIFSN